MVQGHDLAVANTFFQKKEEHLITFKSGPTKSQIDYLLVRRNELKGVKNCKVIPGECLAVQHRMVLMDFRIEMVKKKNTKKVKWWRLKESCAKEFVRKIVEKWGPMDWGNSANIIWKKMADTLIETAVEVLGETKGGKHVQKETKWWDEEVQKAVRDKKTKFKQWQKTRQDTDHQEYLVAKKATKKLVAAKKTESYAELYKKLDSREGEKMVYRLARAREKGTRDLEQVKLMKDKDGKVILDEEEIRRRWSEYFGQLLNKENPRVELEEVSKNQGVVDEVKLQEVEEVMEQIRKGKATGPDGIPVEAFLVLEELGAAALTKLFNAILKEGKMPDDWRERVL